LGHSFELTTRRALVATLAVTAGWALLLVRLTGDVAAKPLHQDEGLAGLLAARPLPEVLATVLEDRGGAPLHFVLAHVALAVDASPAALRWLSVVFALLAVGLCYDLGRRLAGVVGAATAGLLAASSELLAVYGSFGRMYSLFAFAAALACDLFVRAVHVRTAGAAAAAAGGAWVLAAAHPYGGIVVAAELLVALAVWRGRPLRAAAPVALVGLAFVPLLYADIRLADRFEVGEGGGASLASPEQAARLFVRGLGGIAGGREPILLLFVTLAAVGLVVLARRTPPFAALTVLSLAAVPLILVTGSSGGDVAGRLSTRHFVYALPFWTALVGAGVARLLEGRRPAVAAGAVGAVLAAALLAPTVVEDPRDLRSGTPEATAAPAAWLRDRVERGDVLFPSVPVFLAALPATGDATPLSRGQPGLVRRLLERLQLPAGSVYVAVHLDFATRVNRARLEKELGPGHQVHLSGLWLLVQTRGPFDERVEVARAALRAWTAAAAALDTDSPRLTGYLDQGARALCGAVRELGASPAEQGCAGVGDPGFEPGTSALSERRSNRLS
jgi:hypothetical protein